MLSLGTSRASTAGNLEALTVAETNLISALGAKDPTPSNNPLEVTRQSLRGRDYGGTTHPVETTRASPLPGLQGLIPYSPNPDEEEGEMMLSDADILNSIIARALLDALQERWTGDNLPPAMTPMAHIRATQLQQCFMAGKEPSNSTIQVTLDLISLRHNKSSLANLAKKCPQ